MKLQYKFLITLLSIAFIPFVLIGTLSYSNAQQLLIEKTLASLSTLKELKVQQISDKLLNDKELVTFISNQAELRRGVLNYQIRKEKKDLNQIFEALRNAKNANPEFKELLFIDTENIVVSSTNEENVGREPAKEIPLEDQDTPHVGPFFENENGTLTHYLTSPIRNGEKTLGIIAVKVTAKEYSELFTNYTELGETGEIVFVVRKENFAMPVHPLRFDSQAAFKRRISLDDFTKPVSRAITGKEGIYSDTIDYRNVHVLSATKYFPELDAALAVKIDKSEALADVDNLKFSFFIIALSVLLFAIPVVFSLTKRFTTPINELLIAATKLTQADFNTVLTIHTKDEIGNLAQAFQTMSEKLKESYENLEQKVESRTAELETSKKIADERANQAERFNKVMIGRELKMIELKKEIKMLQEKKKKTRKA